MTETMVTGEPITARPTIGLDLAPQEWLLSFVAGRSIALHSQLSKLLTIRDDAPAHLPARLRDTGSIDNAPRLHEQRAAYLITASGLRAIGSDLPLPRVDVRRYWFEPQDFRVVGPARPRRSRRESPG